MEIWTAHIIGWRAFFLIVLVLIGLIFLYRFLVKEIISDFLSDVHGKQLDTKFIVFQRFLFITWFTLLIVSFVMVSPFINGVLTLVFIFLLRNYISNYIQGTLLIKELGLIKGMHYSIDSGNGIIDRLSSTGMMISMGNKNYFVAYNKILEMTNATQLNIRSSKMRVVCSSKSEESLEKTKEKLMSKLFISPFLREEVRPTIEIIEDQLVVNVLLKNQESAANILETISKCDLIVIKKEM